MNDSQANDIRPRIRTIDLFCGAGGSSYGARLAGAEIVAAFDNWQPAIDTYNENFGKGKARCQDIRELCPETIKQEVGEVDLILGSPECTNHSRAKGNVERSEESRQTAFEVTRFAKVFQPEWIVVENVVEMRAWNRHKDLRHELESLGYCIEEVVLNAKDFGVRQSRKRLFMLCARSGKPIAPTITKQSLPINGIIDKNGRYQFSPLEKPGRAQKTIETVKRAIEVLGKDAHFLLVYYGSGRESGNGGWQKLSEPLRTITTLDRFAYVKPGENGHVMRMLQPEELKLAMGFKSDFKLMEVPELTRRDRIKLMGNGVCPPVMEAIVRSLTGGASR